MQRIQQLLKSPEPVKWLFYGDSITHGALHTFGARDYTEHFTERVRTELGRTRDVMIKTAISGNSTRELLEDFDWRVAQFKPQAVFLMIGMNDCSTTRNLPREEFRGNLVKLCRKIQGLNGVVPILQTTCLILPNTSPDREPNYDAFMDAIREVAAAEKLPLVDHARHWREMDAKTPGILYYWMSNAFHPNAHGHLLFARHLFQQLGIFDPQSTTCRLHHLPAFQSLIFSTDPFCKRLIHKNHENAQNRSDWHGGTGLSGATCPRSRERKPHCRLVRHQSGVAPGGKGPVRARRVCHAGLPEAPRRAGA